MNEDDNIEIAVTDENSDISEVENIENVEVVEVEPLNSAGLTRGQTNFFALGFFVVLMVIYFICQRGSISGRST